MTDKRNESVREWLRDIYGMEGHSKHLFTSCLNQFESYPDVYAQLESWVEFCSENQTRLSIRMQQLGTNYSTLKNIEAELLGRANSLSAMTIGNEMVKAMVELYSYTLLTIGSYKIVIAAAEVIGDEETTGLCKALLDHTESRAACLSELLIYFTKNYFIRND